MTLPVLLGVLERLDGGVDQHVGLAVGGRVEAGDADADRHKLLPRGPRMANELAEHALGDGRGKRRHGGGIGIADQRVNRRADWTPVGAASNCFSEDDLPTFWSIFDAGLHTDDLLSLRKETTVAVVVLPHELDRRPTCHETLDRHGVKPWTDIA
jgi:hypothetical protein